MQIRVVGAGGVYLYCFTLSPVVGFYADCFGQSCVQYSWTPLVTISVVSNTRPTNVAAEREFIVQHYWQT